MPNEMMMYVRRFHGSLNGDFNPNEKLGVVVAIKDSDTNTVSYGWSRVRTNNGNLIDKFDRDKALLIARQRAKHGWSTHITLKKDVVRALEEIEDRALRYFKDVDPKNFQQLWNYEVVN